MFDSMRWAHEESQCRRRWTRNSIAITPDNIWWMLMTVEMAESAGMPVITGCDHRWSPLMAGITDHQLWPSLALNALKFNRMIPLLFGSSTSSVDSLTLIDGFGRDKQVLPFTAHLSYKCLQIVPIYHRCSKQQNDTPCTFRCINSTNRLTGWQIRPDY